MKTKISFIALCLFFSISAFAQTEETTENNSVYTPKWVSEKGYWVIESNIHSPKISTIYFYSTQNELMYKESVDGKLLNPNKRKVKMQLKKVLEQTSLAFEKSKKARENEAWVAKAIR